MHLNIDIGEKEKEVFDAIVKEGGQLFFVGGIVRDTLLKRESKDIDVEVFHLSYHNSVRYFHALVMLKHLALLLRLFT